MNSQERNKLNTHLAANLAAVRGTLTPGVANSVAKQANYKAIRTMLRSLQIAGVDGNVKDAVKEIAKARPPLPLIVLQIEDPGPEIDVPTEIARIKRDCGHAATIRGIYVQLDVDQNKHQPDNHVIGKRDHEGERFGGYASTTWHEGSTMDYLATWAASLTGMIEGKKVEHGQSRRIPIAGVPAPVCFEAYCMLLGGNRYVSAHCYPNSR